MHLRYSQLAKMKVYPEIAAIGCNGNFSEDSLVECHNALLGNKGGIEVSVAS
jgi:hypothetical protein